MNTPSSLAEIDSVKVGDSMMDDHGYDEVVIYYDGTTLITEDWPEEGDENTGPYYYFPFMDHYNLVDNYFSPSFMVLTGRML